MTQPPAAPGVPGGTTTPPPSSQSPQDRHSGQDERYREQLRTAESERDALRSRVQQYQQSEVAGMVRGKLMDESDIWVFGKLDDYLGDDGNVSQEKVDEKVEELLMHKPYLAPPPKDTPTNFGQGNGHTTSRMEREPTLGDLIDPQYGDRGTQHGLPAAPPR